MHNSSQAMPGVRLVGAHERPDTPVRATFERCRELHRGEKRSRAAMA
jgi:hypothetical protein